MTAARPFALEPLADVLRIDLHQAGRRPDDEWADAGLAALAERTRISLSTAHRRLRRGCSAVEADRLAVAVGLHPAVVWGEAWWSEEVGVDDAPAVPSWLVRS